MANNTVGVAILSYAHPHHAAGYTHALTQLDGVRVAAIYDEDEERGQAYARQFGVSDYYSALAPLLERSDIHAVVVCSATDQHAPLVIAAAEAGKHVLCEKPIATRIEDANAMIAACKRAGVQLHIAFPVRFMPVVAAAKSKIGNNEIGALFSMTGGNRGRPPLPPGYPAWITDAAQAGGGAVMDHSVHVTDAMRYLSEAEVESVYAEAATLFHEELTVDDCGLLLLKFRNGIVASVDPSWSMPNANPFHYDFWLRVVGTDGLIGLDETQQTLRVASDVRPQRGVTWEAFGISPDMEMVRHFVQCIRAGEAAAPGASGEDGLRALEIALAAYESVRTGQPVMIRQETVPE
jgi:predicted dehydrogenase